MALENYRTVAERLSQYWTEHPDGRIVTTLVSGEGNYWIFRADVYRHRDDANPVSSGHAHEVIGANQINKTSALEVCESSAVGRALAIYLYSGSQIASLEEVQRAKQRQNENTSRAIAGSKQTKPATITQVGNNHFRAPVNEDPVLDTRSQLLADLITGATSLQDLNSIGQEIAQDKTISTSERAHLRGIFGHKRNELTR